MTHTNLVLGGNWPADEWPDYVSVEHDDGRDRGAVRYAPEKTCRDVKKGNSPSTLFRCSECGGVLASAYGEISLYNGKGRYTQEIKFCPVCGARVEEVSDDADR